MAHLARSWPYCSSVLSQCWQRSLSLRTVRAGFSSHRPTYTSDILFKKNTCVGPEQVLKWRFNRFDSETFHLKLNTNYSIFYMIWYLNYKTCVMYGFLTWGHHVLQHNAAPSASASMARTAMDCKSDSDDDDFLSELLTCHRSVLWISFTMIHPSS